MKKGLLTNVSPFVAALLVYLLVTFLFFTPLFQGKRLMQGDITNFRGMSKEIADHREKTGGEEALWTNSMFGGMPAYQISVKYNANLMRYVDKVFRLGLPRPADYVFLYFAGFFFLLVVMGVSPWVAIIGGLAFGFSSYFIIILEAGHNSKAHAIAYMAPLLGSILLTLRGKLLAGGVLTALFASLQIYTNHLQITYYLLILILMVWLASLYQSVREKYAAMFAKATGVLLLAAVFAILPNFTNLWTTLEYSRETTRGRTELTHRQEIQTSGLDKEYATQWSYGVAESWSLLIPNAKGGGTDRLGKSENALEKADSQMKRAIADQNHYWGDQPFTSGPVYVGAIVMFLFVLAWFVVKGPLKWALLIGTMLSVALAWGKNFMPLTDFFLDHFPAYNKFRAVSMILVLAELTIPLLGFMALWKLLSEPRNQLLETKGFRKHLFIAYGLTGGIALLFYLLPDTFFEFLSAGEVQQLNELRSKGTDPGQLNLFMQSLTDVRIAVFRADAIRSFLFITLAAGLLFAFRSKLKIPVAAFVAGLAILIFADMFTVNKRYLNQDNYERAGLVEAPFEPTEADKLILKDTDIHYRVLNLAANTFNDARTSWFHKSIGGYHGAKLKRFQELIDHQISKNNIEVLNMLNTKYLIVPDNNRRPVVQVNMEALGNAWLVQDFKIVENADEEMDALGTFRAAETAVIDQRFAGHLEGFTPVRDSLADIRLIEYAPNRLVYDFRSDSPQLAVFSEIYYPHGWQAYLDGKAVPHFRANYVLRAMLVPQGEHRIEFRFEPEAYFTGEKVSLAGSLLLLFAFFGMIALEIRKRLAAAKK